MKILSIETSCDETAMALVEAKGGLNPSTSSGPKFRILENLVASQIKIHEPYGGVVPSLAKREHEKNLPILLKKIQDSRFKIQKVDIIAVTIGPGLEPCLWEGINFAKNLLKAKSYQLKANLIGVNHLEGHLYSFLLNSKSYKLKAVFPAIALIVSGGHTILLLMKNLTNWRKLGETRDDAAGEAFDKVARLLNLPYPGGPNLEKIAKYGSSTSIDFPRPMIHQKNYDFSFSGLKTSVLYYLKNQLFSFPVASMSKGLADKLPKRTRGKPELRERSDQIPEGLPEVSEDNLSNPKTTGGEKKRADIAASFQQAVIDVSIAKTFRAAKEFKAQSILLSGGVANNKSLRQTFREEAQKKKINFFAPSLEFTTDNAAMTAVAAYFNYLKNKKSRLIAQANLNL